MSGPDPSKPLPSATGVLRTQPGDASFEADFADLAARFAAQSGGGLSPELSADLALEIVLNEVVEQACLATGATGAAIVLQRDGELVCRASSGATAPELGARLDSASGLSGECIRTCRTQRCDDVLGDQRVDLEASARLGVRSVMVMPLLQGEELVGVFELFSSLPSAFGERDERTLEALSRRIMSNLVLSREPVAELQPARIGPVPATASPSFSEPLSPSEPFPAYEAALIVDPDIVESSPRREFDFVTTFLGAAVLACAVLLGVLLGRHLGFQRPAARVRPAAPLVSANSDPNRNTSSNTNSAVALPVASPPDVEKNFAAPAAAVRTGSQELPPGSLRVYENGTEIFRQSAAQNYSTGSNAEANGTAARQSESSSRTVGGGMQRAASVKPESIVELSPAIMESSVLHRVEPEYPESARQLQLQGPVVLDVRVGQDGSVQQMTLVNGQPLLVQAAEDAVRQWRFKPRMVNGRPATMQTRVTLNFRLPQQGLSQ